MDKNKRCHKCNAVWEGKGQPAARETCGNCGEDLHACLNCRFYDAHKPDQCQVPDIDPVARKDRANYCDDYQFRESSDTAGAEQAAKAKDAWNKLFKK